MKLKITHLYPDLLNFYGDAGNIASLKMRLTRRGIDIEVCEHKLGDKLDLTDTDIVFLGGGGDREEKLVMSELGKYSTLLKDYAENDGVILAVCGGMDMLGRYVKYGNETVSGAGVLDIYTECTKARTTGDVVLTSNIYDGKLVGFINRGASTNIGTLKPLGTVDYGNGNGKGDTAEGVIYKNVIGTHLHGPVLPKNPRLCDYVLRNALRKKYMEFTELSPLETELEDKANEFIVNRFIKD